MCVSSQGLDQLDSDRRKTDKEINGVAPLIQIYHLLSFIEKLQTLSDELLIPGAEIDEVGNWSAHQKTILYS